MFNNNYNQGTASYPAKLNKTYIRPAYSENNYYWENAKPSFDVNKYVNPLTCALHGGLQGYTLNYSDEMMGGLGAIYGLGKSINNDTNWNDNMSDYYTKVRDLAREHLRQCHIQYPLLTAGAEISGAVFGPVKLPRLKAWEVPALGAISGFGAGEGDMENHKKSIGLGISGSMFGNTFGNKILGHAKTNIKPFAKTTLNPIFGKDYSRSFSRAGTQFLNNPYVNSYFSNTLDFMFNKQMRDRYMHNY